MGAPADSTDQQTRADQPSHEIGLLVEILLQRLKASNIDIGPRERISVTRLSAWWLETHGAQGVDPDVNHLKLILAPVLARTPEQRDVFSREFDIAARAAAPTPDLTSDPTPEKWWERLWRWLAENGRGLMPIGGAALVFTGLALVLGPIVMSRFNQTEPEVAQREPDDQVIDSSAFNGDAPPLPEPDAANETPPELAETFDGDFSENPFIDRIFKAADLDTEGGARGAPTLLELSAKLAAQPESLTFRVGTQLWQGPERIYIEDEEHIRDAFVTAGGILAYFDSTTTKVQFLDLYDGPSYPFFNTPRFEGFTSFGGIVVKDRTEAHLYLIFQPERPVVSISSGNPDKIEFVGYKDGYTLIGGISSDQLGKNISILFPADENYEFEETDINWAQFLSDKKATTENWLLLVFRDGVTIGKLTETGFEVSTSIPSSTPLIAASASPSGRYITAVTEDHDVFLWEKREDWVLTNLGDLAQVELPPLETFAFHFLDDERRIMITHDFGVAEWREGADGIWTPDQQILASRPMAQAPVLTDRGDLVTVGGDYEIRVWERTPPAERPPAWTADAYAQRLHELTSLPRETPIDLEANEAENLARLAHALAQMEGGDGQTLALLREQAAEDLNSFHEKNETDHLTRIYLFASLIEKLDETAFTDFRSIENAVLTEAAKTPDIKLGPLKRPELRRAILLAGRSLPEGHPPWRKAGPAPASTPPPGWLVWLALIPLLVSLWFARNLFLKKAYLLRRQPDKPLDYLQFASEAQKHIAPERSLIRRTAQKLLSRTPLPSTRMNIPETINASLREGGMITPVYAEMRSKPAYLFLIEREAPGDQNSAHMRQLITRMKGMLDMSIFYFQSSPAYVETERAERRVSLDELIARYPEHRLVVIGECMGLLDPRSNAPTPVAQKLKNWEYRAILTPIPVAEWGAEELSLAEGLDLAIGRATQEGLFVLDALLGLDGVEKDERLKPDGDGRMRALPSLFRNRAQRLLHNIEPDQDEVEDVLLQLRNYLDPAEFDWLCALAIYPALQWDLTLYFGVVLPRLPGGDTETDPLYSETRLAALAQLPWLRHGVMPNWLRRALLEEMTPARTEEARKAVLDIMKNAKLADKPQDSGVSIRIGQERDDSGQDAASDEARDEVLVDFLSAASREDLQIPRLSEFNQWFKRGFWASMGLPERLAAGAAFIYALTALGLVLVLGQNATATGAYTPLVVLAIGALLVLAVIDVRASVDLTTTFLRRLFAPTLALLIASLSLVTPNLLQRANMVLTPAGGDQFDQFSNMFQPDRWAYLALLAPMAMFVGLALLGARWLASRIGFPVIAPHLEQDGGVGVFVRHTLGLTALVAMVYWLATGWVDGSAGRAHSATILWLSILLGVLVLSSLAVITRRFSADWVSRRLSPVLQDGPRWRVVARAGLIATPIVAALVVQGHFSLGHARTQLASLEIGAAGPLVSKMSNDGAYLAIADGEMLRVHSLGATAASAGTDVFATPSSMVTALAFGRRDDAPVLAWTNQKGEAYLVALSKEPAEKQRILSFDATPHLLAFDEDGALYFAKNAADDEAGALHVLGAGAETVYLSQQYTGLARAMVGLKSGVALALADGVQVTTPYRDSWTPLAWRDGAPGACAEIRMLDFDIDTERLSVVGLGGGVWRSDLSNRDARLEKVGHVAGLGLGCGPPLDVDEIDNAPAEADFFYYPPGYLADSGEGYQGRELFAPNMTFPIGRDLETSQPAPAYLQSAIYSYGGGVAGGDQCDARNFEAPWQDTFCERRTSINPGGEIYCGRDTVSIGQYLRVGSAESCRAERSLPSADRKRFEIVAVEDGRIFSIGSYSFDLLSTDGLRRYRYFYPNMRALEVSQDDEVKSGTLLGYVSNDFGGTPTVLGLHINLWVREDEASEQWTPTPLYTSLISAYERDRNLTGREIALPDQQAPAPEEPEAQTEEIDPELATRVRRHFVDDGTIQAYGTYSSLWGGWATAGHAFEDFNRVQPTYVTGQLYHRPGGLDVTVRGVQLPAVRPDAPEPRQRIEIAGYAAGSLLPTVRSGEVYRYRGDDQKSWIAVLDRGQDPVVVGMSGALVVDKESRQSVGLVVTRNSPADINQDGVREQSLDFIAVSDIWEEVKKTGDEISRSSETLVISRTNSEPELVNISTEDRRRLEQRLGPLIHRDFYDDAEQQIFSTYSNIGSGWATLGNDFLGSPTLRTYRPEFASGEISFWQEAGTGQGANTMFKFIGRVSPERPPSQVQENQEIFVAGYPAGQSRLAIREGFVLSRRPNNVTGVGGWLGVITRPNEPVVTGMGGGLVVDKGTLEPIGLLVSRNSPADLDSDGDLENSFDFVSLYDIWVSYQ